MPAKAKPRKTSSRSTSRKGGGPRKTTSASRETAGRSRAPKSGQVADKVSSTTGGARDGAAAVAKAAAAATISTALAALAGRRLIASRRHKRVLGVLIPRKYTSIKSVARQVAQTADEVERRSLDVSKVSAKAKQAATVFS